MIKIKYYLLFIFLLWSSLGLAQEIRVTATASSTQVGVGEQFEVSFSTNKSPEGFNPPNFNGFEVVGGPNQSSSFSSVNGSTTVNISVGYVLVPLREGQFSIGPAVMVINGKQYRSNGLRIKVVKGQAAPRQQSPQSLPEEPAPGAKLQDISKRLFMRVVPNKTNVYQGEQISVSCKLYTNINVVGSTPEKMPDFNGFWSQEIKSNNQNVSWTVEEYKGVRYHVAVLKEIILFPERFGKLTLDPLAVNFTVRQVTPSNDPIEQFFGGGSYEDVNYRIKSPAVIINVKPLPEAGKPAGFQGAVGDFSVGATLDRSSVKANEALNYTLKISGSGNLKLLKAPELSLSPDIEKYDPKLTDNIVETMNGVSGSREYNYLLIPRHEGKYTIAPFQFSYFNPEKARYVTLSTSAFPVSVAKGAAGTEVTAYPGNQQELKTLGKDIRYIKSDSGSLRKPDDEFYGSSWHVLLLCLGPLLFAAAFGYRNWHREQNKDLIAVKGRNAAKVAAKHLASAGKQLQEGNRNAFYEDVYKGLYGYLSDKLHIAVADLNRENIGLRLKSRGIAEDLVLQLTSTLDLCEMARYAPVSGISDQEVFNKAKNIISDIENHA